MQQVLSVAEMGEADRRTIAGGVPGIDLMEAAGRGVADAVAARQPLGRRIVVLAGPGNKRRRRLRGRPHPASARLSRDRGAA